MPVRGSSAAVDGSCEGAGVKRVFPASSPGSRMSRSRFSGMEGDLVNNGRQTDELATGLAIVFVMVAVVAVLLWYFNVYDTAAGKCHRGDLEACTVLQLQITPLPTVDTREPAPTGQGGYTVP